MLKYYEFDSNNLTPVFVDELTENDYYINESFYFSNKENLKTMRNILTSNFKTDIEVKNGYATLADDVFVQDFNSKFCIPIIKASRGIWTKIIYPYDEEGCLIDEEKLSQDNAVYTHLINYKTKLLARAREDLDNNHWYSFGRSQGLKDTYKNKISINTLIRSAEDLKIINVPSGNGIYSGLYITTSEYNFKEIESALRDTQFGIYVSLLGKYKSGGYYTFSSKDVKKYLNFKLHR
jgi:adenine-specific DNA-methyltransferase